jgi:hypothetical protein
VWLGLDALRQFHYDARLADIGFARDQRDLAMSHPDARPTAQQESDLF